MSDGDSLVVKLQGQKERLRLIGVDTPEKAQRPWGPRAKAFIESLVLEKMVRLELDVQQRDKYGRPLAYVHVNGTFVNLELLKAGCVVLLKIPPNVKHVEEFTEAQQVEAREKAVGTWSPLGDSPRCRRRSGVEAACLAPLTDAVNTWRVTLLPGGSLPAALVFRSTSNRMRL